MPSRSLNQASLYRDGTPVEVERMLADDTFVAEPKLDGVRCMVAIIDGKAILRNRQGLPLMAGSQAVHATLTRAFNDLGLLGDWLFDGELVGDTLHLFDLVRGGQGAVTQFQPYIERSLALRLLTQVIDLPANVRIVDQAIGTDAKRALLEQTKADGGEGIMLKALGAPYVSGRSDRCGVKVKLTKDVDLIVMSLAFNGKENAVLGAVAPHGQVVEVGRCSTIGKSKVQPGDVVEVRFLYVGANGRLVQPRMMRVRRDKQANECLLEQLVAA